VLKSHRGVGPQLNGSAGRTRGPADPHSKSFLAVLYRCKYRFASRAIKLYGLAETRIHQVPEADRHECHDRNR
jgi:hypothetical protein